MLEVRDLHAYYGRAHVLFGLNFELPNGSSTALLGRNGAGKTTTARAIMGIGCRCEGTMSYAGKRVDKLSTHDRAVLGLQLVPEDRRIYTRMTVRQNLELGVNACGDRAPITVPELSDAFPMLEPLLGRFGNQLSGGEQQLVAIARALVARPAILIMDEPSEGLAPVILEDVRLAVAHLRKEFGTAILLTEQNVPFALSLAENVIVIDKGSVVFSGTLDEFSERKDVQESYLAV
jgi:branched-chain amino acid transport system ATP-binding protein